jgi:hypothetical protein
MRSLVDNVYPDARCIQLVLDTLNIHAAASSYTTFQPAEARPILARLPFHQTPKHRSWLNRAEIELSLWSGLALDQPMPDLTHLNRIMWHYEANPNKKQPTVNWHFTTADAPVKLRPLYPAISC